MLMILCHIEQGNKHRSFLFYTNLYFTLSAATLYFFLTVNVQVLKSNSLLGL